MGIEYYLSNFIAIDLICYAFSYRGFRKDYPFLYVRFYICSYLTKLIVFDYFVFHKIIITKSGISYQVGVTHFATLCD